jgi:hypothetical protein
MPGSMLWPLLSMWLGFMLFYGAVLCTRVQAEVPAANHPRWSQARERRLGVHVRQAKRSTDTNSFARVM